MADNTTQPRDIVGGGADYYSAEAEGYAASILPALPELHEAIRLLLPKSVDRGVVLDIGAGVGAMLPVFQQAGASAIFAVEPSPSMRIGLMTYVAFTTELRRLTTVLPGTLPEVASKLPYGVDYAQLLNAVGHLTLAEEQELWGIVADKLAPGGRFVMNLQEPHTVEPVARKTYGTAELGQFEYSLDGWAEPLDDEHVTWTMERAYRDSSGEQLDLRTWSCPWRVTTADEIIANAKEAGLHVAETNNELQMYAFERG